jgi:hypothetical protein
MPARSSIIPCTLDEENEMIKEINEEKKNPPPIANSSGIELRWGKRLSQLCRQELIVCCRLAILSTTVHIAAGPPGPGGL